MPKRSNSFQRLVRLLHERLDDSWTVTESMMFSDSFTAEKREVDIVLESCIGAHKIVLSIECRDHKRKADTPWVESMAKKHESLPTSKLVLWSANGFYKPALKKANQFKIDTVSGGISESLNWAKLANHLKSGSVKILKTDLTFFIDVETLNGLKKRLNEDIDYLFKENDSKIYFRISELKNYIAKDPNVASVLLDNAVEGESSYWIMYKHRCDCIVLSEENEWCNAFRIGFSVKTFVETCSLETKFVLYENTVSTLAIGKFKTSNIELFVQEKIDQEPVFIPSLLNRLTNGST